MLRVDAATNCDKWLSLRLVMQNPAGKRDIKAGIHPTKALAPGLVGMDADAKPPWMVSWRPGSECFGGMSPSAAQPDEQSELR